MPLYNDPSITYNANIMYNGNDVAVPGLRAAWLMAPGGFLASVGSLMVRCIPLFILSIFGSGGPPRGGKT